MNEMEILIDTSILSISLSLPTHTHTQTYTHVHALVLYLKAFVCTSMCVLNNKGENSNFNPLLQQCVIAMCLQETFKLYIVQTDIDIVEPYRFTTQIYKPHLKKKELLSSHLGVLTVMRGDHSRAMEKTLVTMFANLMQSLVVYCVGYLPSFLQSALCLSLQFVYIMSLSSM